MWCCCFEALDILKTSSHSIARWSFPFNTPTQQSTYLWSSEANEREKKTSKQSSPCVQLNISKSMLLHSVVNHYNVLFDFSICLNFLLKLHSLLHLRSRRVLCVVFCWSCKKNIKSNAESGRRKKVTESVQLFEFLENFTWFRCDIEWKFVAIDSSWFKVYLFNWKKFQSATELELNLKFR